MGSKVKDDGPYHLIDGDGVIYAVWLVRALEHEPGTMVSINIGGARYSQKLEPQESGDSHSRAIRNALVSALEHALSERMGLLAKREG